MFVKCLWKHLLFKYTFLFFFVRTVNGMLNICVKLPGNVLRNFYIDLAGTVRADKVQEYHDVIIAE